MGEIKNVHDKFFKELFSQRENVKDFLKGALPAGIVKEINFDKIKLENTEYIDKEYKSNFSDLVVKTELKNKKAADIYILFEHKSYRDRKVILQLLSYMLKMWKQDMDNKHDLRIIIPLVFYHGKKKWDIPVRFRENVNLLTGIVLMKNVYYNNYSNLRYIFNLWAKTGFIKERELVVFFTRYMVETEDIDAGEIGKLLAEKLKGEDIMPTLAQRRLKERREGFYPEC